MQFDDSMPIYKQLHDHVIQLILNGALQEGECLPSIRQLASEFRINHLTVTKAIQMLVDENIVEKKRGVGMFIKQDAVTRLKSIETERFLNEDWPKIVKKINMLNIDKQQLIQSIEDRGEVE